MTERHPDSNVLKFPTADQPPVVQPFAKPRGRRYEKRCGRCNEAENSS